MDAAAVAVTVPAAVAARVADVGTAPSADRVPVRDEATAAAKTASAKTPLRVNHGTYDSDAVTAPA
jgi:hypothetical protein